MADFVGDYTTCWDLLLQRLQEPAPGRIQLLTGPRQVGKTTLLLDIASRFGEGAVYAAGDEPDAALPGFWERKWTETQECSRHRTAVLLLDEVHHIPHWAERLKGQWDNMRRKRLRLHIIASGSSALRVTAGSRESLAGRFERVTLNHWSALSLSKVFHLTQRDAAFHAVRFGSYPGPWRWKAIFSVGAPS